MENLVSVVKNKVQGVINSFSSYNKEGSEGAITSSPQEFNMHDPFTIEDDITNGLCFNNVYLPQEVVLHILSFLPPNKLLQCSLVCKHWCNLIKSTALWQEIYNRLACPKKVPNYPWYIFYCYLATENFTNLLKNGNGQNGFKNWRLSNGSDKFKIEQTPIGAPPLSSDIPDFQGYTSCFSTSYQWCVKCQEIALSKLMRYIVQKHKPTLYVSEWYNGRFDCACIYALSVRCLTPKEKFSHEMEGDEMNVPYLKVEKKATIDQWANKEWEKLEILVDEYDPNINRIIFGHAGKDQQFWAGNYGSKMAGGVVKFLIESIRIETENLNFDVIEN